MPDNTADDLANQNIVSIELTKGDACYRFILSEEDQDIACLHWNVLVGRNGRVYAHRSIPGRKKEYLARRVLERKLKRPLVKGELCVHLNGVSTDNTRDNVDSSLDIKLRKLSEL